MIWKKLFAASILMISLIACVSDDEKEYFWEPDLYAGHPSDQTIVRNNGYSKPKSISCSQDKFDAYICIEENDMQRLLELCSDLK